MTDGRTFVLNQWFHDEDAGEEIMLMPTGNYDCKVGTVSCIFNYDPDDLSPATEVMRAKCIRHDRCLKAIFVTRATWPVARLTR